MRVLVPSQSWIALVLISLLPIVPTIAVAKDNTGSAYAFVQKWITTYGIDHARAATMMTTRHRGGMSEAEWVDTYTSFLEYVKYKHLGGELISAEEEGHKAKVTLKSTVDSIRGPVVQYEIYDLLKVDGGWLIDYINILDDNFETAAESEPTPRFDFKRNELSPNHAPSE
ncbi:MAG TPA: hypothetical protein EYN74_08515 [Nitrospirales bacterium]|nr:hypothetical protein [Nitrospirales bacterium]